MAVETLAIRHGRNGRARGMLARYLAIGFLLTLSGCVEEPTRTHVAPRGNEGAVLFKISENRPVGVGYANFGGSLAVRRVPDATDASQECFQLRTSMRGLAESTFMGAALPPGTYEFPTIGSGDAISEGACNARVLLNKTPSQFAKFVIEPGKLTYLGAWERSGGDKAGRTLMVPMKEDRPAGIDEVLGEVFPDLAKFAGESTLGWVDSTLPRELDNANRYALSASFGLLDPAEGPDGTMIFGSRAGIVRAWKPGERRAAMYDTGRRVVLKAMAIRADGSWLAGGEQSTLLFSPDRGATWRSVRGDLPYGLIIKVVDTAKGILLTLVDGDDVYVYRGDPAAAQWRRIAAYRKERAFWTGVPGVQAQSFLVGSRYVTLLPSKQVAVLDVATERSELRKLPGGVAVFTAGRDEILRCICVATIATNPYYSTDFGKTWVSSPMDRFYSLPAMRDAKNGVVWARGQFGYTRDGAQTWATGNSPGIMLQHMFYAADGSHAYATNDVDQIWRSGDDGMSWQRVLTIPLPPGDRPFR